MYRCWSKFVLASIWILVLLCSLERCIAADPQAEKPPATLPSGEILGRLFLAKTFESKDGGKLPYRILKPLGLNPDRPHLDAALEGVVASREGKESRGYPLVLFLHGAGERGDDNVKQLVHAAADFARLDRRQGQPAYVVCPQCPKEFQWVDTPWNLPDGKDSFSDTPTKPLRMALELVESLKESLPIDPDRVYVTGLSMGGYGAWHAAGLHPDRFAAVLPVCGGSDPTWAPRYNGIPIWSFHGDKDTAVPVGRGREIISALALAGHQGELRYTEYEGVGHNSWTRTYSRDDFHEWLFRQRRSTKSTK